MPSCRTIGAGIIVCGRNQRRTACKWCGKPTQKLCDRPVIRKDKKGTCDAPMCGRCATQIKTEYDLCPPHFRDWEKRGKPEGSR